PAERRRGHRAPPPRRHGHLPASPPPPAPSGRPIPSSVTGTTPPAGYRRRPARRGTPGRHYGRPIVRGRAATGFPVPVASSIVLPRRAGVAQPIARHRPPFPRSGRRHLGPARRFADRVPARPRQRDAAASAVHHVR